MIARILAEELLSPAPRPSSLLGHGAGSFIFEGIQKSPDSYEHATMNQNGDGRVVVF